MNPRYVRAARVFPATDDAAIEDGIVVLDNGRIVEVKPAHAVAGVLDHEVSHYPTATVMPGLVDAHAHLTLPADRRPYEEMIRDPDEMLALISLRNLRLHLAAGVTTLRDNGGRNRVTFVVREAIERGYFEGPRLLLSGRPVTHTRGHFHWCNGVADGVEAIRTLVRELVAEGADHIKIMASGGGTSGTEAHHVGYSVEELRAAVDTAHEFGRPTTAHCRAKESMERALAAGLDCIEHGEFLVRRKTRERRTGLIIPMVAEYDPQITEQILTSGTFLSFTMQAGGYEHLLDLRAKHADGELSSNETGLRDHFEHYYEIKYRILDRYLHDGMSPQLVLSTDAGPYDAQFGNIHLGMEMAVEAGMSPTQAVIASTRVAARACGVDDMVGTLEPGKEGDLVVVDGNPFADVRQMASVLAVFKGGRLVGSWEPNDLQRVMLTASKPHSDGTRHTRRSAAAAT